MTIRTLIAYARVHFRDDAWLVLLLPAMVVVGTLLCVEVGQ